MIRCRQGRNSLTRKGVSAVISIQKYVRAKSLEEAYQLNQSRANRVIGGMLWTKTGNGSVNTAIDLCDLGLDGIEETQEAFLIGAMTSLRRMELHQGLNTYTQGAAGAAVRDIIGVQFRNLATVGGSIWGRFGFSDVLTFFLSLETFVELYKGGIVPLEQFAALGYDRDILVRLIVKKKPGVFAYRAFRNQRTDLPVLTCALSRMEGEYRAVIGARPGRAIVVRDEEGLLSGGQTEGRHNAFSAYVARVVPMGSNTRGSAAYRTHLARVLTERNLMQIMQIMESGGK